MDLKIGTEIMIYSRSQNKFCPAKIIGLEGDLSQHQLAKSGEKIGRGWVEVKYMPPCPSITKNVKIGDIKYDPSLLPSPPREEEEEEDMEPEPEGQSEEERRMEDAKEAFKLAMDLFFLTRTTDDGELTSVEREYLDRYSTRDVAAENEKALSIYNNSYGESPWGRALFDRMWAEEVSRRIGGRHADDAPDEPGIGAGGFRRKSKKRKTRKKRKSKKRKRSRRKSKTKSRR